MKRLLALALFLGGATVAVASYDPSHISAAQAPVQTVNSKTGNVTIPARTVARGTITPSTSTGVGTLTFATQSDVAANFTSTPTCYFTVQSSNTNYVFAQTVQTSVDTTQVTISLQAALKLLSISLGALTVWTAPPTGTTVNVTCSAPA